ncbi:hypothetical protein [Aestuariicoccus sp. MJ-SS9]|uniref:hypothetical protein n=1 Tax=Aestuariicoccus sp. MJ-SS9 TaxID=3079855 RepID=UPI00290F50B6|nr:hypothetical protein [Aestuariicoccus sp. MJ-SS9]MDU8912698.1 hypothetical protein [Aestuariicoccus sp. MJ-SS9]
MKIFSTALFCGVFLGLAAEAQTTFPSDYKPTCPVGATMLDGWFATGAASAGGKVDPADSVAFPPIENTKCDFYRWGAQMFLWLTSPDNGGVVLDSAQFLDVVETSSGFAFEDNSGAAANTFALRTRKEDSIGGTGQAGGGGVLLSQAGSLAYYGIHTNDIYAQFLTGNKAGAFNGTDLETNFPISQADMDLIAKYVGAPLDDAEAMTMELKTAWVDASTVDAGQFITILAEVPSFDRSSDTEWPVTGTETITLALVGLHIAAPVQGHKEMVWSSFEHISVSPAQAYYYLNASGQTAEQAFSGAGEWIFFPTGGAAPAAVTEAASFDSSKNAIVAKGGETIRPVSVVQQNPWGLAPADTSAAQDNTDLVSLNATLLGMLQGLGDVRGNYLQLGGIWTAEGQIPDGDQDPALRGGLRLANATMETFHQLTTAEPNQTRSCFTCHNTGGGDSGLGLSHIFDSLAPLP